MKDTLVTVLGGAKSTFHDLDASVKIVIQTIVGTLIVLVWGLLHYAYLEDYWRSLRRNYRRRNRFARQLDAQMLACIATLVWTAYTLNASIGHKSPETMYYAIVAMVSATAALGLFWSHRQQAAAFSANPHYQSIDDMAAYIVAIALQLVMLWSMLRFLLSPHPFSKTSYFTQTPLSSSSPLSKRPSSTTSSMFPKDIPKDMTLAQLNDKLQKDQARLDSLKEKGIAKPNENPKPQKRSSWFDPFGFLNMREDLGRLG
jgi:hypothetical protein